MMEAQKKTVSKNYDTCICLVLSRKKILSLISGKTLPVLQLNGVEVTVLMENEKGLDVFISGIIYSNPLINWRFIFYEKEKLSNAVIRAINSTKKLYCFFTSEARIDLDEFKYAKYLNKYYNTIISKRNRNGMIVSLFCKSGDLTNRLLAFSSLPLILETVILKFNSNNINELKMSGQLRNFNAYRQTDAVKQILNNLDFNEIQADGIIFYDYLKKSNEKALSEFFLKQFPLFEFTNDLENYGQFKIIALVQTFNEIKNINSLLNHLDNYCDGIILLDDGSTDGTFEAAKHDKLIIKVKKIRSVFNDLENRNILLNLVSFFNHQWAFFIDADERFDPRFDKIYEVAANREIDVIAFQLINLWDSEEEYRTDIPDSNQLSKNGILARWRMFRNIGRCQIISSHNLHFPTVPYFKNPAKASLLLKHYGIIEKELRIKKHDFYLSQDENFEKHNGRNYAMLGKDICYRTRLVESITISELQ